MKDNNAQQNKLSKLLTTSDYNEVRVYLKRSKYLKNKKDSYSFWQSNLPTKWFNKLIKEPFFEDLLFSYLRNTTQPNESFLKLFLNSKSKQKLIKIIKLSEVFNHPLHWKSFSIFKNDSQLKIFYKELSYVKSNQLYWLEESKVHDDFIKSLSFEDIIFQMTMCYETFKQHPTKASGNRSNRVSIEAILIHILNSLLNLKKNELVQNEIQVNNTYDVNHFQKITAEEYKSLNIKYKESVEFYIAKYDNEYQINKYLTSFAEFESIDGLESELVTNNRHSLYRKTLERGRYDETYLTNMVVDNKEQLKEIKALLNLWDKQFKINVLSSIEYFNFLNIPTLIPIKKNETVIDLSKVIYLLKTFSDLYMPQGETIINDTILQRQAPENFKKLFYSDFIVCFEENEFINKCKIYFEWSENEIKNIIDFITTDINIYGSLRIDIKTKPLIKIGNQYFWLSSFMRDRRWEIAIHKKMVKEDLINPIKVSNDSENYLSEIFKEANFNAISSKQYSYNGKNGEIDIMAYKNGVLFIGELKSTYVEEDIMKSSKYETQRFNSKASDQLDLAKDYIINNFDEIKDIEELNIDCSIEDIKIETLIISNIYQSDHLLFNSKHLKISLFELLIILKNDLYNMLVTKISEALLDGKFELPIDMILNMYNRNNPNNKLNNNTVTKESCNLWTNLNDCSPNDIITAIKENKVWSHQDTNTNYPLEEIKLSTYNKQFKYLS